MLNLIVGVFTSIAVVVSITEFDLIQSKELGLRICINRFEAN